MNSKPLLLAVVALALACVFVAPANAGAAVSINITQPTANSFHKSTPAMYFSKSGIGTYTTCYYDNFQWFEDFCSSPWVPDQLTDGTHTYYANIANNDDTEFDSDSVTFTIDKTAPTVSIGGTPAGQYSNATQINLNATVADVNPYQVHCRQDGGGWVNCTGTPTGGSIFVNNVSEGAHVYQFKGVDKAGNETIATYNVTIDRTPPSATLSTDWGSTTRDNTPAFKLSWLSEIPTTRECRIVGRTEYEVCSGATWVAPLLADGHELTAEVKITDAAGNVGLSQLTFHLDATLPDVVLTPLPGDVTTDATPTIAFQTTDAHDFVQHCEFDAADWDLADLCNGSYTPPAPLSLGQHTFWHKATDSYGNVTSTVYAFDVVAEGQTGSDPQNGQNGGQNGGRNGGNVVAPAVTLKSKSSRVKRGKFTATLTFSLKSVAAANSCGGKLQITLAPGVKKAKKLKKSVALKPVGGVCTGVLKVKLPAKLKRKKATLRVVHGGNASFAAISQNLGLKRL